MKSSINVRYNVYAPKAERKNASHLKRAPDIEIPLSKTEVKGIIKTAVGSMWQNVWNKESKWRHLFSIQHKVGIERKVYGITETVELVLLHCEAYNSQRKQFVEKLRDMEINDISAKNIFQNAQKQLRVYDFLLKYLRDTDLIRII